MNRELAKGIEEYLLTRKVCYDHFDNGGVFGNLSTSDYERYMRAQSTLKTALSEVSMEDITELFSDLRAYWDTLEVSN